MPVIKAYKSGSQEYIYVCEMKAVFISMTFFNLTMPFAFGMGQVMNKIRNSYFMAIILTLI